MLTVDHRRVSRWYFGGFSATLAVPVTYPFAVIKTGIEIEQVLEKITAWRYIKYIRATKGLKSLYSGVTYSMQNQLLVSTIRFGLYEKLKQLSKLPEIPILWNVSLSTFSGAVGGFIRTPYDMINTRMQADLILEPKKRRNYVSTVAAFKLLYMLGGYKALFYGASVTMYRTILLNVSQITSYEKSKLLLMRDYRFGDDFNTHLCASLCSGVIATAITQPFEVIRAIYIVNTEEFSSIWHAGRNLMERGVRRLYRGSAYTLLKLVPQTMITFVLMEQLRLYFGFLPSCYYVHEKPPGFWKRTYRRIMRKEPPPPIWHCDKK